MDRSRLRILVLLALGVSACLRPNPAFDAEATDAGPGATSWSSATSSGGGSPTSSGAATGEGSSTSGTSAGVQTSTAATSGVGATSDGTTTGSVDTSTSGSSTGGAAPGTYEVPASIGTCVFVASAATPAHGGPDECSGDADLINDSALAGLMMVDVNVNDMAGKNRPAHPYLRFDVPAEFAGLNVASATLHVQVADNVMSLPQSGELWRSQPFDGDDLTMNAPLLVELLAADQGEVQPDQWLSWSIPPALVTAGVPLFFGLRPTHDKGVMLRGAATVPGAPYLQLELQ